MGNEVSGKRKPDIMTFNLETPDGNITINTLQVIYQKMAEADLDIFNLSNTEDLIRTLIAPIATLPHYSPLPDDYALNWGEVTRTLRPVKATILNNEKKLATIRSMELSNTSDEPAEHTWTVDKTEISQEIVKRKWYAETNTNSKMKIGYEMLTLTSAQFSRHATKTTETESAKFSKLSSQNNVKVTLKPQQSLLVELQAILHSVDIEIEYEASLMGAVLMHYKKAAVPKNPIGFKRAHDLLQMLDEPTTVTYKEIVTLEYYTDGDKISMTKINT